MIVLPRGKPVKEDVATAGMNWREVLQKLHDGRFTGYLNFVCDANRGLLLFYHGQLAAIRYGRGAEFVGGETAMQHILSASRASEAYLDIYRLEADLAHAICNLVEGQPFCREQHLALLDLPHLLALLKQEGFSGGLHVYDDRKATVILMENGSYLGFFHDGQAGIVTSADPSASVACNAGARLDVIGSAKISASNVPDYLEQADLFALWEKETVTAVEGF